MKMIAPGRERSVFVCYCPAAVESGKSPDAARSADGGGSEVSRLARRLFRIDLCAARGSNPAPHRPDLLRLEPRRSPADGADR